MAVNGEETFYTGVQQRVKLSSYASPHTPLVANTSINKININNMWSKIFQKWHIVNGAYSQVTG